MRETPLACTAFSVTSLSTFGGKERGRREGGGRGEREGRRGEGGEGGKEGRGVGKRERGESISDSVLPITSTSVVIGGYYSSTIPPNEARG